MIRFLVPLLDEFFGGIQTEPYTWSDFPFRRYDHVNYSKTHVFFRVFFGSFPDFPVVERILPAMLSWVNWEGESQDKT